MWKECSNEEGRNLFRTEAELEERHNNEKLQDEKSKAARSYSCGERQWIVRNEESEMKSEMRNQSNEGPRH